MREQQDWYGGDMVIHLPIWKPTSIVYMEEFALSRCFSFRLHQSVHHWHDMTYVPRCCMWNGWSFNGRNSPVLPLGSCNETFGDLEMKTLEDYMEHLQNQHDDAKNQGSMRVMQVNFLHPTSKTNMQQRQTFNLNPSEKREPALPTARKVNRTSSLVYIILCVSVYNYNISTVYSFSELPAYPPNRSNQHDAHIIVDLQTQNIPNTLIDAYHLRKKQKKHCCCPVPNGFPEPPHAGHGKTGVFLQCDNFFQLEIGWVQN